MLDRTLLPVRSPAHMFALPLAVVPLGIESVNSPAPSPSRLPFARFTLWSLVALGAGLLLGLAGHLSQAAAFKPIGAIAGSVGEVWIAALQMIALPLALTLTLAATTNAPGNAIGRPEERASGTIAAPSRPALSSGTLSARALTLFLVGLVVAAFFAAVVTQALLAILPIQTGAMPTLPASALNIEATTNPPAASWWLGLVPRNIFASAARGDIFPLLLFTILFGIAVSRLPAEHRQPLNQLFQSASQAMLVMVRWLLVVTPIGVFALGILLALNTGLSWARLLSIYLLIRVGVTLLGVLLLYPISVFLGRTSLRTFARAVFPAQIVAVSTRSSLAALPALIAGGRQHIRLNATATDFVLPLSVSLFRVGTVISNPIKLLFLAHVYEITLRPETILVFIATEVIFSMSAAGIPNSGAAGGGYRMLPVFAAAGIPVEGVIILDSVETIPDIFETMANVTGQMSSATILTRDRAPGSSLTSDASTFGS